VTGITGRNQLETWKKDCYDYHFSYYGGIWGWATWREAWDEYDEDMKLWDSKVVRERIRDVISLTKNINMLKIFMIRREMVKSMPGVTHGG
jgi:hypothetical protein